LKNRRTGLLILVVLFFIGFVIPLTAQSRGLKAISAEDMKPNLKFLGSKEFRGRNAPSAELNIASRYIALVAERIGLKPLAPNGSYYQDVPVEVTTISAAKSYLRILGETGEHRYYFPQAFTTNIRTAGEWTAAGGLVFLGSAVYGADPNPEVFADVDLRRKICVYLDIPRPIEASGQRSTMSGILPAGWSRILREKGALGLVTIIGRERENNLAQKGLTFDVSDRLRFLDVETTNSRPPATSQAAPAPQTATPSQAPAALASAFYTVEVRHEAGASILGVARAELDKMFETIAQGQQLPAKSLEGKTLEIAVFFQQRKEATPNVVAYLPGSDPKLKEEYIVIGCHHDHLGVREARIFPGADDNASGAVAMLEIAKALMIERPKRSVIFVWHTAEEKGLIGAYYFVQHSPVPVEKISANLNLDMIARNDPNGIYLIGSNKVSTELDKSIHAMNDRSIHLKLDYKFEDPGHPDRFFFRSDQYPYIRYGIPGVWFFCGTTEDYHQESDVEEKADYRKMEKVTKLVYLVAMDIGNKPGLLKLDVDPAITSRGKHNMKIVWQRPPAPPQKQ
jgi:hypothetical protein